MDLPLDAIRPRALLDELDVRAKARPDVIRLDLSKLTKIDATGVATLRVAARRLARAGVTIELHGAAPNVAHMIEQTPAVEPPKPQREPGVLERIGALSLSAWRGSLALAEMAIEASLGLFAAILGRRTFTLRDTLDQIERIGADSIVIVSLLSFLLGLVLAFQTWVQLHSFGADDLVLEFVAIGMARGFAPFIVAILISGRTGSAIAAELSTMQMRQENDALRVMGISPVRHLVVPRMIALTLVMPAVTLISTAAGTSGGFVVTVAQSSSWMSAVNRMLLNLEFNDFWLGAVKAVLFGWVIGLAGSFAGFTSGYGAVSIGTAATRAVVSSIFFIMVVDAIVTTIWTMAQ